jgi:ribosomal protein S18 acetylase RimI-like enzyme
MTAIEFSHLDLADYGAVMDLWNSVPGVRANETPEELGRILARNPQLSWKAQAQGQLVGAVLCCHDGRRGYLYHLAVAPAVRGLGVGRELVERSLAGLSREGIRRCSIFLITDNAEGEAFWKRIGWRERTDLKVLAKDLD